MKTVKTTLVVAMVLLTAVSYSQTDKIHKRDSVDIALEREVISKSLIQIRDTINQTIRTLDEKRMIVSPKSKHPIDKATRELLQHRDRIEKSIEEFVQSGKNWNTNSMMRIKNSIQDTRREYKRIYLEIKPYLSATKS
ncbi:hypothetical protein ACFQ21_21170 [Ohtaekwangia kribbensis]|jgi:hypothetical protein|uniref:Uncharacterized protein n=1 Tax=Ohtaekwangia kribbensis TaxID=688913 RepID=A0ABW3K8T8_9BACT